MALTISGPASALLLLAALLAAAARADVVTTPGCAARGVGSRVRQYPVDSDATGINLHSCRLTGIQQYLLSGLPAVTTLDLAGNKLSELPVFEEHVCANLTRLLLYKNQLTGIYNAMTFSASTKLEQLHLENNQIEFINTSVFTALTHLRRLELQGNVIRYIPDQMFDSNGKLEQLYLQGKRITHLPSEFASRLKRAGTSLDEFIFNDNPWHCACLVELLTDVRRAGVRHYNKGAYNGTRKCVREPRRGFCSRIAPTKR